MSNKVRFARLYPVKLVTETNCKKSSRNLNVSLSTYRTHHENCSEHEISLVSSVKIEKNPAIFTFETIEVTIILLQIFKTSFWIRGLIYIC